jgi:hypothetical protein
MTIYADKKRLPIVPLIGLVISALLIWTISDKFRPWNETGFNESLYVGAYCGLLFWIGAATLFSLVDYFRALLTKKANLTIDESGINDNLSIFSVGNINWADIKDIKLKIALKTDFLVIEVTDPQSYITRKSRLTQKPLKSLFKKFGSPIAISQKRVSYKLDELKDIIDMLHPK